MKTAFKFSILTIAVLHLFKPLLPFDVSWPLFGASALALATGLGLMSGIFRYASLVFLACGSALLTYSGKGPDAWASSFGSMTNVIAIIVIMQLFALPLALGGYQASILLWVRKTFQRQRSLFLFTTALEHILTSFLSFGSVPVVISLLENTLKKSVDRFDRYTATAVSRGYALSAIWAPGAINVFLVLEATGVEWSTLFLPGILLAALGIALSLTVEIAGKRVGGYLASRTDTSAFDQKAEVSSAGGLKKPASGAHIFVVTGVFLLMVFTMEKAEIGSIYNRIILSGIIVSTGWMLTLAFIAKACSARDIAKIVREHWKSGLLKAGDLAPFFIAMGAFSGGLEQSGALESIKPVLSSAAIAAGPVAILAVPVLIVALGLLGVHPFITIVLFGKILASANFDVPPVTIALLLASSGVVSYMVSPFTGIIMTIAKFVGATAYDVAVRWNWAYCLLFAVMSVAFSFGWGWLFG